MFLFLHKNIFCGYSLNMPWRGFSNEYIATEKALFSPQKMLISFLFLHKNICCGYSLEAPQQGTSNEYPQHVFNGKIRKIYCWYPFLSVITTTCFCVERWNIFIWMPVWYEAMMSYACGYFLWRFRFTCTVYSGFLLVVILSSNIHSLFKWRAKALISGVIPQRHFYIAFLTLVLLNLNIHCLSKQCRSRSVSF